MNLRVGIDIGSTTVKVVVLDPENKLLFRSYERHFSKTRERAAETLRSIQNMLSGQDVHMVITGSAGLGVSKASGIDFVQEVYATAAAVNTFVPETDAVIELGGEDAKIIFFGGALEERMNGSCAGGTGAFIDQMASLLNVTIGELNELSLRHEKIYPIASRCGVFAKSDIQPILNQGGRKEDIAASIFQAVVDQTVAGLTQGRELKGRIVFLGGPLHFLTGLRQRFVETLHLDEDHAIFPADGDCFAAMGAALCSTDYSSRPFEEYLKLLEESVDVTGSLDVMPPLFSGQEEYDAFLARHNANHPPEAQLSSYSGDAWLGIDAGSTTTKMALIDKKGGILYSYYHSNQGNPVAIVLEQLKEIYRQCADRVTIKGAAVTGYGEELIKNAFQCDLGLVETMAHYKAAAHFNPDVDFIIDIGGQDMKCFKIRNGAVDSIMLNEACSSGCGSFIETFAKALGYDIAAFSKLGLFSPRPVNLGSRCTVFMNSSVKQAQKDGASVEDISAGLSISIVKNAVYKVIRAASADDLGKHIVVQGGTFLNDAVLRAFEQELNRNVVRPTIAGLMGAFGAALAARDLGLERSSLLSENALRTFSHTAKPATCGLCTNHCSLTVNQFDGGRRFISGNRCSRPLGKEKQALPDLTRYKYEKLRAMEGKGSGSGVRGRIGIPFGLNMYENLPFWYEFFTRLNFEVVLSPESSRKLYLKGQHTIPSDTVCYPAKLLHGHVEALVEMGVDAIWYPCMSYNYDEGIGDNHYNCPVVAYYPELLAANVPILKETRYLMPYVGLYRHKDFQKRIARLMEEEFSVPKKECVAAAEAAYAAYDAYKKDLWAKGQEYIAYARERHLPILVQAGRPYHIDPEINHGINDLITGQGFVLISEDALSHLEGYETRKVLNQWTFQSRMYNAARYVCTQPDMQLVQLVSFGCGTDAITADEVRSILEEGGKLYTQLKIDDINNLGAVKIRIRSLMAAMEARQSKALLLPYMIAAERLSSLQHFGKGHNAMAELVYDKNGRLLFTKEMKKDYTLLAPQMLPDHFAMVVEIVRSYGYKVEMLENTGRPVIDAGQKYVHNDACYPAILVIGQLINAIQSGKYDPHKVALVITQTGGGCRASNYIHLLRKALEKADLSFVPVISLNLSGLESNPGFQLTVGMLRKVVFAIIYGDLILNVSNQVRPYEVTPGDTDACVRNCMDFLLSDMHQGKGMSFKTMKVNFRRIIDAFKAVPVSGEKKVLVGVVGEIYVKYAPLGNNNLCDFLLTEGAEPVVPGVMDFIIFKVNNRAVDVDIYGGKWIKEKFCAWLEKYLMKYQHAMIDALKASGRFRAPGDFHELHSYIKGYLGDGNKMGEGWLLTAEMLELIHTGVPNIVCTQPFGCLPNHIVGKGMIRKIKDDYPWSNIVAIDYDPGATKINQENRIKLMLANARALSKEQEEVAAHEQETPIA